MKYFLWPLPALLLLFSEGAFAQGEPCGAAASVIAPDVLYTVETGAAAADLELYFLRGNALTSPLTATFGGTTPRSTYLYLTNTAGVEGNGLSCAVVESNKPYGLSTFVPSRSGSVALAYRSGGNQDFNFSLFAGTFDPAANNCGKWVASNRTDRGIQVPTIYVELVAGQTYSLVYQPIDTENSGTKKSITFSGEAAPALYPAPALSSGRSYTYFATEVQDNVILEVSETADFRALPAGAYKIRGVDYATETDTASWVGLRTWDIRKDDAGNPTCLAVSSNNIDLLVSDPPPPPVVWEHVATETSDEGVTVTWVVASETDNDFYRVERSRTGGEWLDLGEVAGNGTRTTGATFNFTDTTPSTGINFYRIAQTDFDGTVDYSETVTADWIVKLAKLSLFPNPMSDRLNLQAGQEPNYPPRLFDGQGREVTTRAPATVSGKKAELDVSALPAGTYLVQWAGEQLEVVKK